VSTRLKAVVCEFAMLPEMFSERKRLRAKPGHRGGESAEDTHTVLRPIEGALSARTFGRGPSQATCHDNSIDKSIASGTRWLRMTGAKLPGAAGFAGLRRPASPHPA
jgi:hypothetical protein